MIKPLGDRILAKRTELNEMTATGIYIPTIVNEKSSEGEVVAVGEGRKLENGTVTTFEVKVGDKIILPKFAGTELKIDGVEYILLREEEILGIVESDS